MSFSNIGTGGAGRGEAGGRGGNHHGVGGMYLPYPSVPPPSLATSLASTTAPSPMNSPVHSRAPSMGRIAERGSFAGGREAFEERNSPMEEEAIDG